MGLNNEASPALVFLILYALLLLLLVAGYATKRLRFLSRYTTILFHVVVRLASQATGLAFGIVGYANPSLLVAYFILGAEGYFTLVLCTFRFLISWQERNTLSRTSWLETKYPKGTPFGVRFINSFRLAGKQRQPMAVIHHLLVAANTIIIVGGSLLAGGIDQFYKNLGTAKALRAAGQSVFLAIHISLLFILLAVLRQCRRETGRTHTTLLILLAIWPLLFVRGLYGVLAAVLPAFNYFNPANYTDTGLSEEFVVTEYILGTLMEWASCALLMSTYFTSRHDPTDADADLPRTVEKESENEIAQ